MAHQDKRERIAAALTRFGCLIVIIGISYLGNRYRSEKQTSSNSQALTIKATPAPPKTANTLTLKNQASVKPQSFEEKNQISRSPSPREISNSEVESYGSDRTSQAVLQRSEQSPTRESVRQHTKIQTTPGTIRDVIIEPQHTVPVQALR